MQLDDIVIQVGQRPVTLLELLLGAGGLALVLLIAAVILAWRAQASRRGEAIDAMRRTADLEYRLAELSGTLRGFAEQAQGTQIHLARTLDERLNQVSHRLGASLHDQTERTSQSLSQLNERLAVIDSAQKNLTALSSEMVTLKDILANKQARGAYGQGRMEALPDSALRLVIDAKFPLEAFNALKTAKGDSDIKAAESQLRSDVLRHVKDISSKYLIAGETHESAIMFVPSEAVYAELYERFEDVIQKAHRARVIIASPNVLMLLIQTMQAIFKDARMREQAGLIQIEVTRMLEDVNRLKDRVADLQRHFGMANADLEKLGISADRVTKRGLRIESLDLTEPAAIAEAPKPRLVERG
ncbi:MAG: DNA recombination protein RmuC [Alphaproteobacteria bacterium]|nr:DNA recombination protein RmuC [Alphaproteobacteria bacterium]